jgi:hypothetical protein
MKICNSPLYGKIKEPESFDELISILTEEQSPGFLPIRYWRGQSDIEWTIDSAGARRIMQIESRVFGNDYDKHLFQYEQQLIEHATHKGYRYQNGRELYDLELLARLQHHGAATRMVDFSKNAFVALYFCVINDPGKTGLLFGLHTSFIYGYENQLRKETYAEIIKECEEKDAPTTWEPPLVSPRMAAQHAQFLFSKISTEKTGSLLLPREKNAKLFIAINAKLKPRFKSILEGLLDLRTITLFPDIDGFGSANSQNISRWDMNRW